MNHWVCPRSILFAPADKPDIARKAFTTNSDAVCIDLEDGVSPQNKGKARDNLDCLVRTANETGKLVGVRINSTLVESAQDIVSLPAGVDHIVIPKARGWSQLLMVAEALQDRFPNRDACPRLIAMVEDLASIQRLSSFTASNNATNIAALALGSEDLSAELGVKPNHELLTLALYDLIKIGSQLDVPVLGFTESIANFEDLELLAVNVARARQLGARGAFCIHPKQIQVINEGFSPTADEIRWAQATLSVKTQVEHSGVAVHPLTHQMVDRPVLFQAQNIIERSSGS